MLAVAFDQQYVTVISWGRAVQVSYPWLATYMTECWAILSHQLVAAGHDGAGIDVASLQADLAKL